MSCETDLVVYFFDYRGILISSSSNSLDTAIFCQTPPDRVGWQKYELEGTGRAEFPLDKSTDDETFAAGMAVDFSSQEEIVVSEWRLLAHFDIGAVRLPIMYNKPGDLLETNTGSGQLHGAV